MVSIRFQEKGPIIVFSRDMEVMKGLARVLCDGDDL
jgi:hypothetical protein